MNRLPTDQTLPFFAYGTFKSSELAFRQIEHCVIEHKTLTLRDFELAVIDGLPKAFQSQDQIVHGELITLKPEAYEIIANFEQTPRVYRWTTANSERGLVNLVVHVGEIFTRHDRVERWDSSDDTLLADGMVWAIRKIASAHVFLLQNRSSSSRTGEDAKMQFLELQATYAILWSVFERATLFCEGPLLNEEKMMARIQRLSKVNRWQNAVEKASIDRKLGVRSSSNPNDGVTRADSFGFEAWYKVRNNVIHKGKTADKEFGLVLRAASDMFRTLAFFLQDQSPSISRFLAGRLTPSEKDLILLGFTQTGLGRWEKEYAK